MENQQLENYLAKLDKALGPISVSEKAEIITEIKSHVLEAQENNSEKSLSEILNGLGEPEQVANKYLLERGLEIQKPPKHPIVKWLVIGFLGSLTIFAISFFVLISKFTPIINVDEKAGRVQILGGLIDIESTEKGKISISGESDWEEEASKQEGEISISSLVNNEIFFVFTNTKVEFKNHDEQKIKYECKIVGHENINSTNKVQFDFQATKATKCEFSVPKDILVNITASNGKFKFNRIKNHLTLKASNGKVEFKPSEDAKYNYKFDVINGKIDDFQSSDIEDAYKVAISLSNGKISN